MFRVWLYCLLLLLALCSCASRDFRLVQKATAYDTYYQSHYVTACIEKAGPSTCLPCQTAINEAAKLVPLANAVQKVGPMPAAEVAELKALVARLEACP